jgi:NAD-dependent oxidoreductase involved in siderophore biosynthesis
VAGWLTARGYPTTLSAVKNATRPGNEPAEGVVAGVPASLELLRQLVAEFPGLEVERLFAPADAAAARVHLVGVSAA